MSDEAKHYSSFSLLALISSCDDCEQGKGTITGLEIVGEWTISSHDGATFPDPNTLVILPAIGDSAPPAPAGTTFLFLGDALVLDQPMRLAVFRKN